MIMIIYFQHVNALEEISTELFRHILNSGYKNQKEVTSHIFSITYTRLFLLTIK